MEKEYSFQKELDMEERKKQTTKNKWSRGERRVSKAADAPKDGAPTTPETAQKAFLFQPRVAPTNAKLFFTFP